MCRRWRYPTHPGCGGGCGELAVSGDNIELLGGGLHEAWILHLVLPGGDGDFFSLCDGDDGWAL